MKQLFETSGRSLWQVLALYAGASWVVLQVVDVVKDNMGLPDWVFPFALILLLIGLPIIVATAMVQGRRAPETVSDAAMGSEPDFEQSLVAAPAAHHRFLTWKNSLVGGGLALVFLAIVTSGFMYMRNSGIGPVGSLVAKGLIDERSEIMVADFEAEDDMLGRMASEALRVDLSQSNIVRLVNPRTVEGALKRMQLPEGTRVDEATAREIAEREGIAAVVGGEILSGGGSYVITAHLVSPGGDLLGNARVTAADSSKIIEAIDKLSRNLREQIGESYTSMRESPALAQVSTSSLEALRKYTEAGIQRREGNLDAAIDFLEEAIAIDSTFAMAYRGIGIFLQNKFDDWSRQYWAHSKAYEYRDRLTEREKWLVSASYHLDIEEDESQAIAAYENVLRIDPELMSAVNNIGVIYYFQRDWEKALKQYRQAHEMRPEGLTASNVGVVYANMGMLEEADEWLALSRELEPNSPSWKFYQVHFESLRGNKEEARRLNRVLRESESPDPYWLERTYGTDWLFDVEEGRIARAEASLAAAVAAGDEGEGSNPARALQDLLSRAELDLALGNPESTVRRVDAALDRFPLEEIPPLDRPTAWAASLFAQAGDTNAARTLLAEQREQLGPLAERKRVGLAEAEAWIDVAEGRYAEAIPVLRTSDRGYGCDICIDLSVGTAFDQAGQPDSAVVYYESYLAPRQNWRTYTDGTWRAWTLERLGQLYDELGDLEQAAGYYAAFVELWEEADPELQPRVQAAQARLEEIVRERG
jgi:tetratricopeptide (TPR) repeat protein